MAHNCHSRSMLTALHGTAAGVHPWCHRSAAVGPGGTQPEPRHVEATKVRQLQWVTRGARGVLSAVDNDQKQGRLTPTAVEDGVGDIGTVAGLFALDLAEHRAADTAGIRQPNSGGNVQPPAHMAATFSPKYLAGSAKHSLNWRLICAACTPSMRRWSKSHADRKNRARLHLTILDDGFFANSPQSQEEGHPGVRHQRRPRYINAQPAKARNHHRAEWVLRESQEPEIEVQAINEPTA